MLASGCKHFSSMPKQSASLPSPTEASSFQACTALSHINLGVPEPDAAHPNRCLPDCCFLEAGIVALAFPQVYLSAGSLLYMARCAFAGCTQCRAICKQGKSKTWRGTYVRPNAFDKCEQLDLPEWHRVLPADASDLWREDFLEPAPKASNAFAAGMVHKHSARKLRQVKCANITQGRQFLFAVHDTVSQ